MRLEQSLTPQVTAFALTTLGATWALVAAGLSDRLTLDTALTDRDGCQAFFVQALHQPLAATVLPANNGQPPVASPALPW